MPRRLGPFVMPSAARHPEPRARIPRVARNDKNRLLLPLLLALLLGACGSAAPASTSAPASAAKPAASPSVSAGASAGAAAAVRKEGPSLSFKFASSAPETDLSAVGYKEWAKQVDERTAGRIKFQFFWAGSLLTSQRMFDGLRDGLADFGGVATASMSGQVGDVAPFEVPFAYPLDADLLPKFYAEITPFLGDVFKAHGAQAVWISPSAVGDPVSCKSKFLDSAKAWQGALVRTAGKWQARTLQLWGAKPVTIDSSEAYAAVQRGTVDCLLYSYNLWDSGKMYEVTKYLTRIDHSINLQMVAANPGAWSKLPPDDQKILTEAGNAAQAVVLKDTSKVTLKALDDAKTNGVHLCTPSQQELQRLRQATDVVLDEIAQQQTDKGKQLDDILARYRGMAKQLGPAEGDMTPCPAQ